MARSLHDDVLAYNHETTNNNNCLICDSAAEEAKEESKLTKDVLISTIGHFGKWQCRILILMTLLQIPIVWFQFCIIFLAPPTNFYCFPPLKSTNSSKNIMLYPQVNHIFAGSNNTITISENSCVVKDLFVPSNKTFNMKCRWGYHFDTSVTQSSVITEWDLVCDRHYLKHLVQILLVLGMLLGNITFGAAADSCGRKKVLIITTLFQAVFSTWSAFTPSFWMFLLTRFLLGFFAGGAESASFVMCMEVVGGKWRTIVNIVFQMSSPIAMAMMAVIAYFIRDWRSLQLVFSVVSAFYLVIAWVLPKSPIWLLAVDKKEEASIVLKKAAKVNGIENMNFYIPTSINQTEDVSLLALLKTPQLRKRTLLLSCIWFMLGINYFGYNQYMGQVKQDIYFSVLIGSLISLPSIALTFIGAILFGRRTNIMVSNMCSLICLCIIYFLPSTLITKEWRTVGIASQGIFWVCMSLPAIYIFTVELYPTVVRNSGFGSCATFQKLGAMLIPFLFELSKIEWLIPLIFGCILVAQTILVLPLPETQNRLLLDTIEETETTKLLPNNIINERNTQRYQAI